jgi:hypothetical protein
VSATILGTNPHIASAFALRASADKALMRAYFSFR